MKPNRNGTEYERFLARCEREQKLAHGVKTIIGWAIVALLMYLFLGFVLIPWLLP